MFHYSPYAAAAYASPPRFSAKDRYLDALESVRSAEAEYLSEQHRLSFARPGYSHGGNLNDDRVSRLRAELARAEEEERILSLRRRQEEDEYISAVRRQVLREQQVAERERALRAAQEDDARRAQFHRIHRPELGGHSCRRNARDVHAPSPRGRVGVNNGLESLISFLTEGLTPKSSGAPAPREREAVHPKDFLDALGISLLPIQDSAFAKAKEPRRRQQEPVSDVNAWANILGSMLQSPQMTESQAQSGQPQIDLGDIFKTIMGSVQDQGPTRNVSEYKSDEAAPSVKQVAPASSTSSTAAPEVASQEPLFALADQFLGCGASAAIKEALLASSSGASSGPTPQGASSSGPSNPPAHVGSHHPLQSVLSQFLGGDAASSQSAEASSSKEGNPSPLAGKQHPLQSLLSQFLSGDAASNLAAAFGPQVASCGPQASPSQVPGPSKTAAEREAEEIERAIRLSLETASSSAPSGQAETEEKPASDKGKAKITPPEPKDPSQVTSKDIADSSTAIENVAATYQTLINDFNFPARLDFTPASSRVSSPDSAHSTSSSSSVISKLTFTSKNAPVRYLDNALSQLIERLDEVETWGNEELRNRRKTVISLVEDKLEEVEREIQGRWRSWSAKQEKSTAEPAQPSTPQAAADDSVPVNIVPYDVGAPADSAASAPVVDSSENKAEEHDSDWSDAGKGL